MRGNRLGQKLQIFLKKKKKMQPHAFLLLLWYFQKKKFLANFPFLKITIFFFFFEGDIRVREWENREKIELKCCANKMAKCLDVLGRMLSRRGMQWEVEFCNYKRASLSFVKDNVWLPSQPPQAVIPPSVIKKETHTLFSVYPLKLADNPTRTTAPQPVAEPTDCLHLGGEALLTPSSSDDDSPESGVLILGRQALCFATRVLLSSTHTHKKSDQRGPRE